MRLNTCNIFIQMIYSAYGLAKIYTMQDIHQTII